MFFRGLTKTWHWAIVYGTKSANACRVSFLLVNKRALGDQLRAHGEGLGRRLVISRIGRVCKLLD